MSKEGQVLKYLHAKGKNKRIEIYLGEDPNGSKVFITKTKTLIDFKTRNILKTHSLWSVETFYALQELMGLFFEDAELVNKVLLRDLNKVVPFVVDTNLKVK